MKKKGTRTVITTNNISNIDTDAKICFLYRIYSPESGEISNNSEYAQCSNDFWQYIGYHFPLPIVTMTEYNDCSFIFVLYEYAIKKDGTHK